MESQPENSIISLETSEEQVTNSVVEERLTPELEMLRTVREILRRELVEAHTEEEIAELLGITKPQARLWLSSFVKEAVQAGWCAEGIEPSGGAEGMQKAQGVTIRRGSLAVLDAAERFDRITMWHVLEHIPFPGNAIKALTERLTEGGKLVICVPNYSSPEPRLFRSHWALFDVPRH